MHGSIGKNVRPSGPLNEEHAKVECAGKPTGIAIGMHGSIGKKHADDGVAELQTNINSKVGNDFTIAGMTLENNISKEELLKSLGFEFADII